MKQLFEASNYSDLKLPKRIEDLERCEPHLTDGRGNRMRWSVNRQEHRLMSAARPDWQRYWQGFLASAVALVAFLLLSVNSLYGQSDALFIHDSGNVGIGTRTPGFPLTFPNQLGDKISLSGQSGPHFGFGIRDNLLQIHTDVVGSDIAFGYGKSDPFKENMRIKGNGNVGIGTNTPGFPLSFPNTLGDKISLYGQSGAHYGIGIQGNLLQIHTIDAGADIAFGYGESASFTEKMRIKGNGNVSIAGDLFVKGKLMYYWGANDGTAGWKHIQNGDHGYAYSVAVPDSPSDVRLKTELHLIPSALEKVSQLRGVTFHWNEQGLQYLTRDIATTLSAGPGATDEENRKLWQAERDKRNKELSKTSAGVVAQDVEAVLPEAVTTDETGYKSVKYYELIPLVIEALKEENKVSQEQAQTIARQQAEIQRLTVANQTTLQQLNELQEIKQKLELLDAKFQASGLSGDHDELVSAGRVPAAVHSSNPK